MKHQINLGIQIIPITTADKGYPVIDECIALIKAAKIPFTVTAFETILEGSYHEIMTLVNEIYALAIAHSDELVVNIRIHAKHGKDVCMKEKIEPHN
ncbi:thiamine-binding protein [Roseivirga echinicomitans]